MIFTTTSSFDTAHFSVISENLKRIRADIADAAVLSGRNPEDIRLMAVTKTVCPEYINFAIENCGIDLIGENKVQEFLLKKDSLKLNGVEKHLIGHLQTNKVKKILSEVDMLQSVDSVRLAQAVSAEAVKISLNAEVLLEVNIGDEESKTGFSKGEFMEALSVISELPNLTVKGIMTIPPICESTIALEKYFESMNEYFNTIKTMKLPGFQMDILSMGMSGDYREAVLHGSNLVRIGSAIFGARNYN